VRSDIQSACSWLLRKNLIEADHMDQSKVDFNDCVKVTASGFIHLRILCERMEYLYGILTVTPIFDRLVAKEISEFLRRENQQGYQGAYQQARCIELFLTYLKGQQQQLHAAFREFGGIRTGSSFVIKQVESALRYFKNPTLGSAERNLLDE
jgi:hypothetical protein